LTVGLTAILKRLSRAKLCPIQGEAGGSPLKLHQAYHCALGFVRNTTDRVGGTGYFLLGFKRYEPMDRRRPRNRPSRPLVLVVDDHDDTRELYVQSLVTLGFEAIEAADGEEAYRRAWDFHPDIVVTDLALRGGDGWQLIQDLKREPRTRAIPVVLLTGHDAPSLRERAEHEGCAGFFVKPCLPDELATELRHVIDRTTVDEGVSTSL
jgi:two-component system, cell cycle response regulator DivK